MAERKEFEVDRIEEGLVVLLDEEENIRNIPRENFPIEVHPGDTLLLELDGKRVLFAEYQKEKTEARRSRIAELMEKLKRK